MSTVVLDASALLALLLGEPGAKKVEGALGDARMSVVNMAEVASHFHRLGMPSNLVDQMLRPLPVTLVPADAELCCEAGWLRAVTADAGLSLGTGFAWRWPSVTSCQPGRRTRRGRRLPMRPRPRSC